MPKGQLISRLDFLKLVGTAGTSFMLLPLVPFGKALGIGVPATSKPPIRRVKMVGPDGVVFLYPTKPKRFRMVHREHPFDSHFEIGSGYTYHKLVRNNDGSWTTDDN